MIILDATTRSLEVDLTSAVATNQLPFVAGYQDISQSTFAMSAISANTGASNNTTAVTLVAAPGASTSRVLKFLSIKNSDTAAVELWVQMNDNTTLREIWKGTLSVGDSLQYADGDGWKVLNSSGEIKQAMDYTGNVSNTAAPSVGWYSPSADLLRTPNSVTIDDNLTVTGGTLTTASTTALSLATTGGTQVQITNTGSAARYITLTGSAAGNPTISVSAGNLAITPNVAFANTIGVNGQAPASTTGAVIGGTLERGVDSQVAGTGAANYGVLASSTGAGTINYGLYGDAVNAGTNYSGYFDRGVCLVTAGITVGTNTTNKLIDDASNGAGSTTLFIGNASINVTSDENVKEGVRLWDGDASAILRALPVKAWDRYTRDAPIGGYDGGYVGFTAQDMRVSAPWSVNTQGDTGAPWQARYEFLNGIIVKGWQEHDARLRDIEEKLCHQ